MSDALSRSNWSNPFATKYIRPGMVPFVFPAGMDAERLLERLQLLGWRGQVVGQHGAGKSSLLCTLKPYLLSHRRVLWYEAGTHRSQHRELATSVLPQLSRCDPKMLVVIDGFSELPFTSRWIAVWMSYRKACGLLVTTHRPQWWLPVLITLRPQFDTFVAVVHHLLAHVPPHHSWSSQLTHDALQRIWQEHRGNMREALLTLYDRVGGEKHGAVGGHPPTAANK